VDRSAAVRELPALHAVAIRLRDDGRDDHVIAVALELEDDEVPLIVRMAQSKLSALMGEPSGEGLPVVDRLQGANGRRPGDGGLS
jgi:hypothetical protein